MLLRCSFCYMNWNTSCTPKVELLHFRKLVLVETQYQIQARVINFRLKYDGKLSLFFFLFFFLRLLNFFLAFRVGKREPLPFAYSAIKSTPHISLWLKESLILPGFESTLIQGHEYSHYSVC